MARSVGLLEGSTTYPALQGSSRSGDTSSPTASKVLQQYLKTSSGVKNCVFKIGSALFEAASLYNPSRPGFKNMANLSKDAKNFSEVASLYEATGNATERFWSFIENPTPDNLGGLLHKMSEFLVPLMDVTKVMSRHFIPLTARTLAMVNVVGASSTVLGMSFGTTEELDKIGRAQDTIVKTTGSTRARDMARREVAETQVSNSCITIARNLHYTALGSFSLAAMIMEVTCPPVLMVSLAAGGVATTILGHFHKEMFLAPVQAAFKERFVSSND